MIESLLIRYGLLAIFLGAGVEGEAVVMAGGVIAYRGYVPLAGAMIAATLGSFLIDQLWFAAGRRYREHRFVMRLRSRPAFGRALDLLARYPTAFILAFRFIYGMRTVSPVAIGMSTIPARRFVALNFLAASIWAPLFTYLGYRFGDQALALVEKLAPVGLLVLLTVALCGGLVLLWLRRGKR